MHRNAVASERFKFVKRILALTFDGVYSLRSGLQHFTLNEASGYSVQKQTLARNSAGILFQGEITKESEYHFIVIFEIVSRSTCERCEVTSYTQVTRETGKWGGRGCHTTMELSALY